MIKPSIDATRDNYLSLFADYLRLFNQYTQTLWQDDTSQGYVNVNEFVKHAQRIMQIMEKTTSQPTANMKMNDQITWLRNVNKVNPPLFFYNAETMRGLKLIPALAKSLPKNVESVPWPKKIVEDAHNWRSL